MTLTRFKYVFTAAGVSFVAIAGQASAGPNSCENRVNNNIAKLMECVTVEGVRAHQQAFQDAADANGGIRASGTPGYDASSDYVAAKLTEAGYNVTIQDFEFPFFEELSAATLDQLAPVATSYPYFDPAGFATMSYSGAGTVIGVAQAVDVIIPADPTPNTSTSGCEATDFAAFTPGNIAIVQRGSCSFALKAINAEAAGASAVVIFNEGQPGRVDAFLGTLGGPVVSVPVVAVNYNVGVEFATVPNLSLRVFTDTTSEIRATNNIIADSTKGRDDNVVVAGAHLDSVSEGPGIQDNGSGSATILEVALQMAKVKPRNKVRFTWWGAEESGLLGSYHYVDTLDAAEREKIALYLNFDMIGSPNFARFVYDGDGDAFGLVGPPGSDAIEQFFETFYGANDLASEPTEFSGRSDYAGFIDYGIPAGGLFTGAEGIKTAAQEVLYGGTAGEAYDPCYHQACDTFDNISLEVLDQNADAVAASVLQYAMSTETINGIRGKGNFKARPAGLTFEYLAFRLQR